MPTCENCHNKWSWKQTMRKTMSLNPAMSCPYCEKTQYQSLHSKKYSSMLSLVILLPLILQIFFDLPGILIIILIPIIAVAVFFIYPFLVTLSCKEEFPY